MSRWPVLFLRRCLSEARGLGWADALYSTSRRPQPCIAMLFCRSVSSSTQWRCHHGGRTVTCYGVKTTTTQPRGHHRRQSIASFKAPLISYFMWVQFIDILVNMCLFHFGTHDWFHCAIRELGLCTVWFGCQLLATRNRLHQTTQLCDVFTL
jgi:hypothetical protein